MRAEWVWAVYLRMSSVKGHELVTTKNKWLADYGRRIQVYTVSKLNQYAVAVFHQR
jgi:hypothetical protein